MVKPLELNGADYRITSPSIRHGGDGSVFECALSPVTEETLAALRDAVGSNRWIRLRLPNQQPLLLERIEVVRVGPGRVKVAGRVVRDDG